MQPFYRYKNQKYIKKGCLKDSLLIPGRIELPTACLEGMCSNPAELRNRIFGIYHILKIYSRVRTQVFNFFYRLFPAKVERQSISPPLLKPSGISPVIHTLTVIPCFKPSA